MSLKDELTAALLEAYQRTGEEIGYWAHRFRGAVLRSGGFATAKRMLGPRTAGQRAGLDALLDAGRPELTVEAIVRQPRFRSLFTPEELNEATERLGRYKKAAKRRHALRPRLYPDELEAGHKYFAGARKQVRVNAYERDPKARDACLARHGFRCAVCDLLFTERYGQIGKDFIHVHHLKPLALSSAEYELDPVEDLRPVCPNCHAMLHRGNGLPSIEQLRRRMSKIVC
jgi:5-methylcytosine-specific restriction protein A